VLPVVPPFIDGERAAQRASQRSAPRESNSKMHGALRQAPGTSELAACLHWRRLGGRSNSRWTWVGYLLLRSVESYWLPLVSGLKITWIESKRLDEMADRRHAVSTIDLN
jgi:hypothetical protein